MNTQNTNINNQKDVEAPKKIKYQCLHTEVAKECTCIRSKGLVLKVGK